jgi:hypothetical protein
MRKINIFWIEDNPIPDNWDENGFPKFRHENMFSFHLFQHPVEVKEYLSMINDLSEKEYSNLSILCPEALPDIVVFDYKLSDNFNTRNPNAFQYNLENHHKFLEDKSAASKLKSALDLFKDKRLFLNRDDVIEGNYRSDEFKNELSADKIQNIDDEFGLYSGVAIIREFKQYITLGVPATVNKADKTAMSINSLFYEWLNSYDIKKAIERPDKDVKDWDEVIAFAIPLLQERIKTLVQSSKITPSFSQLEKLVTGDISERTFSFNSIYGERILPLDGLFIDVPVSTRAERIAKWAGEILQNLPLSNEVIKESIVISNQLWNAYLNCFEDRMILSDYTYRLSSLNKEEKDYLVEVKKRLDIDTSTGLIADKKEFSIWTLTEEQKDRNIFRLSVLITVTTAAIELEKQRKESGNSEKYPPLSKWEYFNILFPKVNLKNQIFLPMHIPSKTQKGVITGTERKALVRDLTTEVNPVNEENLFEFSQWISKGEMEVLKSIFYKERKYYPDWVK